MRQATTASAPANAVKAARTVKTTEPKTPVAAPKARNARRAQAAAAATAVKAAQAGQPKARRIPARQAKADAVAKAQALAPELPVAIGSTPATKYRGNPDVFGRLVQDHDRHRALLAMVAATTPSSTDRPRLFKALALEVSAHAAAEEQALWSSVLRHPETTEDGRHAVAEHKELDKMLADLAARDPATRAWGTRFAALRDKYLHHIREEEQEQFVAAERHLNNADLRHMRQVFNRRKQEEKAKAELKPKLHRAPL